MTTSRKEQSPCQGAGYRGTKNRHQTVSTHGDNNSSPATDAVSAADFANVTEDTELDYFSAPNKNTKFWTVGTITWGELIEKARTPDDHKECGNYVLGRFEGKRRTNAAVVNRCALALDADYASEDFLEDTARTLREHGLAAIIHTTFSSEKPDDETGEIEGKRFRVIIPLARKVGRDDYKATALHWMELLGKEQFDPGSKQAERYMYLPSAWDKDVYAKEVLDGSPLEPEVATGIAETDTEDDGFAAMPAPESNRPGDLYAAANDWEEILTEDKFKFSGYGGGGVRFWEKPGGANNPRSVKTGIANDVLHVLSTSVVVNGVHLKQIGDGAEANKGYSKFGYYAAVHHGGDMQAAAEELKRQGYVEKRTNILSALDGDRDIAEAILPTLAGRVAHTPGMGWIEYKPSRGIWQRVPDARVLGLVMEESAKWATDMFQKITDPKQAGKLLSVRNDTKGRRIMSQLATLVLRDDEDLDTYPDMLCVGNGVVRLDTGELLPHDPMLLLTKGTPTPYKPGARHPDWDKALESLPPEKRDWFQGRIGQGITGYPPPDDRVVFLRNAGGGAKSTLISALQRALGEHMTKMPERVLTASGDAHPTEVTELKGTRLAYSEELPEGAKLNVKRLKDIAGTDMMDGRRMHKDTIRWQSTHTMLLTTNYLPRVVEVDHGTWRRLVMVEFPYKYVDSTEDITDHTTQRVKDADLRPRLTKGAGGRAEAVLAWAIDGARAWYAAEKAMAPMPAGVKADTAYWRGSEDLIAGFIEEHLEFDPAGAVFSDELYDAFRRWQSDNGRAEWSSSKFKPRFEQHELVAQHHVETVRTRNTSAVSEDPALDIPTHRPKNGQFRIVRGVRWSQSVTVH